MGRRRRRDRPLGDRPVGRLRDDHLAAPHQRPLPTRQVVLPHYLAALAGGRPAAAAPAGGCVLELLRSPFVAPAPGAVGDRGRARPRPAGMGRPLRAQHDPRPPPIRGRHVHERDDVLYARPGRRRAPDADREDAHRHRSRDGLCVLGARDRLLPRDLSGVLAPRDGDLAARCARRIAAHGGRAAVGLPLGQERRPARRAVTGEGAVGGPCGETLTYFIYALDYSNPDIKSFTILMYITLCNAISTT